jgi:hypothetical protein
MLRKGVFRLAVERQAAREGSSLAEGVLAL